MNNYSKVLSSKEMATLKVMELEVELKALIAAKDALEKDCIRKEHLALCILRKVAVLNGAKAALAKAS